MDQSHPRRCPLRRSDQPDAEPWRRSMAARDRRGATCGQPGHAGRDPGTPTGPGPPPCGEHDRSAGRALGRGTGSRRRSSQSATAAQHLLQRREDRSSPASRSGSGRTRGGLFRQWRDHRARGRHRGRVGCRGIGATGAVPGSLGLVAGRRHSPLRSGAHGAYLAVPFLLRHGVLDTTPLATAAVAADDHLPAAGKVDASVAHYPALFLPAGHAGHADGLPF